MPGKKVCGLWGAQVKKSKFNNNGNCPCFGCSGADCPECAVSDSLAAQSMRCGERTKCFLCQTFATKNR